VVCKNNRVEQLIQVCYTLNSDNIRREQDALFEAMTFFKLQTGIIITFDQKDYIIDH
jgi:uncharacterized protein